LVNRLTRFPKNKIFVKQRQLYKSNTIKTKIEKVIYGGSGIATFDGIKVFVPYSAPGDVVQAKIVEKKSNYYVAKIKKIIAPSPQRTEPPCPYFKDCGGCDLQHIKYDAQLEIKKAFALESLDRIGHITLSRPLQIISSPSFHYRNKTQYPLMNRPLKIGFYKQLSHHVVDIEHCLLHPQIFDDIRTLIKELIIDAKEPVYNEIKHTGNLKHIQLRQGINTGEILVTYVTRTPNISEKLYATLPQKFSRIIGITQNINSEKTNRILGNKNKILFGNDYFYEQLLDKKFKVSANSFFQINTTQAENLVKKLREYIGTAEQVLDLYCGVGVMSIATADLSRKIYGVEASGKAICDALENIKLNNIGNIEYKASPVEFAIKNYKNIDTVILDPPRKGCSESVLHDLAKLKPQTIIYISCNPTTFARDLATLQQRNYYLEKYELIDMFPQTYHVESIAKIIPK